MKQALSVLTLLGCSSFSMAGEAQHYYLYVTTESDDHVHLVRFDASSGQAGIVESIEVGYQPTEIEGPHGLTVAPDGRHWFVTMAHGKPYGILYKYATGTNELVGECELGLFPATMQISESTGLLYCVNFDLHGKMEPSSVSIVDPEEMVEVARTITGPMPHGSRLTPNGDKHYSCAMMSGELFEIDAFTFEVTHTFQLTEKDDMGHEGHGEHGHDEHAGHGEHAEAAAGKGHEGMKHSSTKPTWVYPHPESSLVYVALNGADQVVEVDTKLWKITRRFPTDKGPYNVEISPDGKRMLVTYKSSQGIGIWDVKQGLELKRLKSSRRITHGVVISDDSRFAFVSSEGVGGEMGTLDVIDLRKNEVVSTVELGLQAGGIYFWKSE